MGIGTTNPTSLLHVNGPVTATGFNGSSLAVYGPTLGTATSDNIFVNVNAADSFNGNGGINVYSNSINLKAGDLIWSGARSYGSQIYIGGGFSAVGGAVSHAPIIMSTAGAERMRIANSGNVGIGINSPVTLLHVNGTITTSSLAVTTITFGGVNNYLYLYNYASSNNAFLYADSSGHIKIVRNNVSCITIAPSQTYIENGLTVTGGNITGTLTGSITGNAAYATTAGTASGLTGTPNITVNTIYGTEINGTTTTASNLYVSGVQFTTSGVAAGSAAEIYIGVSWAGGIKSWVFRTWSDRRLKTNIIKTSNNLDVINKLIPVNFTGIISNTRHTGFIAQDVETVIPDAISQSANCIPNINIKIEDFIYESDDHKIIVVKYINDLLSINSLIQIIINENNIADYINGTIIRINKEESNIVIKFDKPIESPFILYGTCVDDVRGIDMNPIIAHSVGAIQELSQIITQQEEKLAAQQSQLDKLLQWAATQGYAP